MYETKYPEADRHTKKKPIREYSTFEEYFKDEWKEHQEMIKRLKEKKDKKNEMD